MVINNATINVCMPKLGFSMKKQERMTGIKSTDNENSFNIMVAGFLGRDFALMVENDTSSSFANMCCNDSCVNPWHLTVRNKSKCKIIYLSKF